VLNVKALVAWLLILCLAVANGALREAVLTPAFGKTAGLVLSGALLSLLVVVVAYGLVRAIGSLAIPQALGIGLLWLCLTVAFEFGFGWYVQHKSRDELLEAYTFQDGNIWPVVLVITLIAPTVAVMFSKRIAGQETG
jgi:hypothetical protein